MVRLVDAGAESHPVAVRAVSVLLGSGESCFLTPQVLIEFWAVATRPTTANGLGWKVGKTREEVDQLLDHFPLLEDTPAVFPTWLNLATAHPVVGKRVHDLRLMAVMRAHDVTHLLTFDVEDFPANAGISLVHPRQLAG